MHRIKQIIMQTCNVAFIGMEPCCGKINASSGKILERKSAERYIAPNNPEFKPNPDNEEYKKKIMGVKKKSYKKRK